MILLSNGYAILYILALLLAKRPLAAGKGSAGAKRLGQDARNHPQPDSHAIGNYKGQTVQYEPQQKPNTREHQILKITMTQNGVTHSPATLGADSGLPTARYIAMDSRCLSATSLGTCLVSMSARFFVPRTL